MDIMESAGVYSQVIDNSRYTDDPGPETLMAMFPIFSARGVDNKIMRFTGKRVLSRIEFFYGKPNFAKFGQLYHNLSAWAKKDLSAAVCRLMPSDAQFANIALYYVKAKTQYGTVKDQYTHSSGGVKTLTVTEVAGLKEGWVVEIGDEKFTIEKIAPTAAETGAGEGTLTFKEELTKTINASTEIYHRTAGLISKSIPSATSLKTFDDALKEKKTLTEDNVEAPFLVFHAIGRGVDYNKLSIAINRIQNDDESQTFCSYSLRVFDKTASKGIDYELSEEGFEFAFDPDAEDVNGRSLNIVDQSNKYAKQFSMKLNLSAYKAIICEHFGLTFGEVTDDEIFSKDIFEGNVDFLDINKNRFANGSDGSLFDKKSGELNWGEASDWEGTDLTNCTNLVKSFYDGGIDKMIFNTRFFPAKYVFDANLPLPAKIALGNFAATSKYTLALIDCGLLGDPESEVTFRTNKLKLDSNHIAIYPNCGYTTDEYTGREIKVPALYDIINNYAKVKSELGIHMPVAGYNNKGQVSGMKNLSYSALPEQKDALVKAQINTIDSDPTGFFIIENITGTKEKSKLSYINIVDSLQDIEHKLNTFCRKYVQNITITDANLKKVQQEVSEFLEQFINSGCCEWIITEASSTPRQRDKGQIALNIRLKFPTVARQVLITYTVEGESAAADKK